MIVKDIEDFSELTEFIQNEYEKISENFGVKQASESMINFTEKALKKYFDLYNKPLFRAAKRELKLKEAIDTMPHGRVWKFFHRDLQAKIEARLAILNEADKVSSDEAEPSPVVSVPAVILHPRDVPQVSEIES